MKDPSFPLLVWGFVRAACWLGGAAYFVLARKRVVLPLGMVCAGVNTIPFVFLNARYPVAQPLVDFASFLSTPTAALIVAGAAVLILNIPVQWRGRWTGFRL